MQRDQQEALAPLSSGMRRRVWCKGLGCGRELFDLESRRRGYGEECDPDYRTGHNRRDVDQEPIPGLEEA